jgi:hypothetical protein
MKIRDQRQEQLRNFGELFDITAHRHKGNEQSTAAFHVIENRISERQLVVYHAIRFSNDGITVDELAVALKTTPNAISGRVSELKAMGKIYKSGTRKTRSGCSAAILKAFA